MFKINIRMDIEQAKRKLESFRTDQVPFAIAKALTETAKQAQAEITSRLPDIFDKPNPFTMRAIGMERANKRNLQSRVFIKALQAAYLRLEVEGGIRTPKKRALLLPENVQLNQYGNMPRNKVQALLARKDVFSGQVRGVGGIWQRLKNGHVKLLVAYRTQAKYRARFPFYEMVEKIAKERIADNFRIAMNQAMATAR